MASADDELRTELGKLTTKELIELVIIERQKKANSNNSEIDVALPRKSKTQSAKTASPGKTTAKQNTPGLGIEYEVYLPAYFALRLNTNPEIKDFKLRSNVRDFGNLDDLLVDIETKTDEKLFFGFQLKHKENSSKNLLPANFEAKGDFSLEKYCAAFKNFNKENKKYHFVLCTNRNFDPSRTNQVTKFDMKPDECLLERNFFDTIGDGKRAYKFEINDKTEDGQNVKKEDFQKFFKQFSLYTGQANIRDLENSILNILKNKECYATYIDFFRKWHRGDFIDCNNKILDKKTLNVHLVDILLSPIAINYYLSNGQDENSNFFETMVQQFDITIIDGTKKGFIEQLEEHVSKYPEAFNNSSEEITKSGQNNKFIDKFAKELKEETKRNLLDYFYKRFIKQLKESIQEYLRDKNSEDYMIQLVEDDNKLIEKLKEETKLKDFYQKFIEQLKEDIQKYPEEFNDSLEEFNKSLKKYNRNSEEFKILLNDRKFMEELAKGTEQKLLQNFYRKFINRLKDNVQEYLEEFGKNSEEYMNKFVEDDKMFIEKLREDTKLKLLHYFHQKPLILDFNESSKDLIYEACKLCKIQETGIKLVIMGKDIDVTKFSHLKIFTNLTKVHEIFLEETKKRCKLSLQGRNISFEEIFEEEIRKFITPREIFEMLKGSFSIGEDKEKLPEHYIPRTVSTTVFYIESVIKRSSENNAIIFYYKDKFEELQILIKNIVDPHDYLDEDSSDAIIFRKKEPSKHHLHQDKSRDTFPKIIILKREECSRTQFNEILKKLKEEEHLKKEDSEKKDIHLFQVVDEKKCLLVMSTKNIVYNQNYKSTKLSEDEKNINIFFNKSINILCAQPGMGKSTLMKYLKNKCESNFWTVMVDIKAHNQFFKRNHKPEEVLKYFLQLENCQDSLLLNIKEMFLRKKKIVLFLDGLDEVEKECVNCVLNITRQLSEMGFRIWLSSRQNLQQKIEQYFNIFAIEINELDEDQQKKYIENRLTSLYNKNEIEEIIEKIFSNTSLANNRQILGIPLQLHVITQIFLDDKSFYSNLSKNNFILTKMLEIFFEGKYKHCVTKIKAENPHFLGSLEEQFENYELVALHSVLDDKHFQKLQIENFKTSQIKYWDIRLGIITETNSENKAVFEHLTFAEYFAAKYLVKNFDKARLLREEIFNEKYQNLLLIFNIMLAEDTPLHLAIIYKDLSRIQEMQESSVVDKGGRNFLQVAACVATRHPDLELSRDPFSVECLVEDLPVQHFKGENWTMKKIINLALSNGEPFKNDRIFEWNFLHYALATGALYIVEAILEKCEKPSNFHEMLGKYYSDEVVAYYSIRFGYHLLLSEILAKESCRLTQIVSKYWTWKENNSILNFIFTSDCKNRIIIVELFEVNKTVYLPDGYTFLHFAIFHNDRELIEHLLEKGADVDIQDKDGWSPLHWAVHRNKFEISKLLLEKGAKVNIKGKNGNSPLFLAVDKYNLSTPFSKLLIEKGADVNIKDTFGRSPLFSSVQQNNLEISKLLVEKGADVNIKDDASWSPLRLAVERNNLQISKFLVEKGADLNIKYENGRSPLRLAVSCNNLEFSKLLVEKGADVNIKGEDGRSPLYLAAEHNNFELSKLLVEEGADVNIKGEDGRSPLYLAAEHNNFELSKLLVEKGADVNISGKDGRSPLYLAAEKNNFKLSKLLVEKGAELNIKTEDGRSSLHWAAEHNNFKLSKLLVEKGADVNVKCEDSRSPLYLAVERNNFELSKLLVEKGADVNINGKDGRSPLYLATEKNNFEISKLLIENGSDVNIKGKDGRSPLYWAAERNNFELSKLLVEKGADVNIIGKDGRSLLYWAAERDNSEISKLLVENGADVNIQNEDGWSPLLLAVYRSNLQFSKLLVEKGADVNIQDEDGRSLLYWAAERDNLEISKFLVEKGADVNIKDEYDCSSLFSAIQRNNLEISKLFVEKGADVNIIDEDGRSPLHLAVERNNLEISELLVEKGAAVNIKSEDGWSPLLLAVHRNNLEISKLLVEKGADVNIKDKCGKSPLFYAVKQTKNPEISKVLFKNGAKVNSEIRDAFDSLLLSEK